MDVRIPKATGTFCLSYKNRAPTCLLQPFTFSLMSCSCGRLPLSRDSVSPLLPLFLTKLSAQVSCLSHPRMLQTWTALEPTLNPVFPLGEAPKLHIIFLNSPARLLQPPLFFASPKCLSVSYLEVLWAPKGLSVHIRQVCLDWGLLFQTLYTLERRLCWSEQTSFSLKLHNTFWILWWDMLNWFLP